MPNRPRKGSSDASARRRKMAERRHRPKDASAPPPEADGPVRLNRFLSQAGVASRRKADALIEEGKVSVNGAVVTELGTRVEPDSDLVEVEGRPVQPQALEYILLNKPADTITTVDDERGRRTVMDLLEPKVVKRGVVPVGRLDRHTTGVLLLTNDGDLAHRLMHPRYGAVKRYLLRANEPFTEEHVQRLQAGVELEDGPARADRVLYPDGGDPKTIALELHEGRNRQVRRMVEALGLEVLKLDRINYASLDYRGVRRGKWRRLHDHEINRLRRLVKLKPLVL